MILSSVLMVLGNERPAQAQVLTSTSNQTLAITVPFGALTPGTSNVPSTAQAQFRLRSASSAGYRVEASAVFTANPATSESGGATVSASDIGVGITAINYGNNVITPRTDSIAAGFNYDPGAVTAVNGLTPYTGMFAGTATLADIVNNPNLKLLDGPQIATGEPNNPQSSITVTIKFGLLGQNFTPASLSGTITLTIKYGQ